LLHHFDNETKILLLGLYSLVLTIYTRLIVTSLRLWYTANSYISSLWEHG